MNVDHRGFSPLPEEIQVIKLDATLPSDLKWEIEPQPNTLWELDFGLMDPRHLPTYRVAVETLIETGALEAALGVILYRGGVPPFEMEVLVDMLHQLGAILPDEVPPFALFDVEMKGSYKAQLFSKELFSHIHLGFRSGPMGAIQWGEKLIPLYHESKVGVVMPLRSVKEEKVVDHCFEALGETPYRIISEMHLTEEWDEIDELIIFSSLISKHGMRKVQGFIATGGKVVDWENSG